MRVIKCCYEQSRLKKAYFFIHAYFGGGGYNTWLSTPMFCTLGMHDAHVGYCRPIFGKQITMGYTLTRVSGCKNNNIGGNIYDIKYMVSRAIFTPMSMQLV